MGAEVWNRIAAIRASEMSEDDEEGEESEEFKPIEVTEHNRGGQTPLTSTLTHIKPHVADKIVEFVSGWCESLGEIENQLGPWLYSLLARLEKPLHPDVLSSLRTIALTASKERTRICLAASDGQDQGHMAKVTTLSLLICLVAKYFGQSDLSD